MLPQLAYERYAQLGGRLDVEEFDASRAAAHAAVREVLGFNEPEGAEQVEACERAIRAAVEVDCAYGASGGIGEGLSSVSIGSFSASAGAGEGQGCYRADMRRAIEQELSGSGLLYQGVGL